MSIDQKKKVDTAIKAVLVATEGSWCISRNIANGLRVLGINLDGRAVWRAMVRIADDPPKGYALDWSQGILRGHCDQYRLVRK